jgi:hypothetical protein
VNDHPFSKQWKHHWKFDIDEEFTQSSWSLGLGIISCAHGIKFEPIFLGLLLR